MQVSDPDVFLSGCSDLPFLLRSTISMCLTPRGRGKAGLRLDRFLMCRRAITKVEAAKLATDVNVIMKDDKVLLLRDIVCHALDDLSLVCATCVWLHAEAWESRACV